MPRSTKDPSFTSSNSHFEVRSVEPIFALCKQATRLSPHRLSIRFKRYFCFIHIQYSLKVKHLLKSMHSRKAFYSFDMASPSKSTEVDTMPSIPQSCLRWLNMLYAVSHCILLLCFMCIFYPSFGPPNGAKIQLNLPSTTPTRVFRICCSPAFSESCFAFRLIARFCQASLRVCAMIVPPSPHSFAGCWACRPRFVTWL